MSDTVEITEINTAAAVRGIAEQLHQLSTEATNDALVYTPHARACYFQDLLAVTTGRMTIPGARERLLAHAEQVDRIARSRQARAERALLDSGLEYRVEPGRTDGQGGYFSPPAWINELFATANRPRRVLADLIDARFTLPAGCSQINIPIIGTGTQSASQADGTPVTDQDITDTPGSSTVAPFAGNADISIQLLEQSPPTAAVDWALMLDLAEATDAQLETELLIGQGNVQLTGVTQTAGVNVVAYTSGSPTGGGIYPYIGQTMGLIGDTRSMQPECWLMRTARWAWLQTSEGSDNLPFSIASPFFIGNTDDTPDPIGGLIGLPVFLDDAIPNTLTTTTSGNPLTASITTTGGTQDMIIGLRPSDLILFESDARTSVDREPLSGALGVRVHLHTYAAAITDRRPAGVGILAGTGLTKPSGF